MPREREEAADALWTKFEQYVDSESWTTPRCRKALARIVSEAVEAEREACAQVAFRIGYESDDEGVNGCGEDIAAAVRARRDGGEGQ